MRYNSLMNERYRTLYDREAVTQRIGQLASSIISHHDNDNPLFVALPRGAMPFASQLMFSITEQAPDFHPELDVMITSRNHDKFEAGQTPEIVTSLAPSTRVFDRPVVLIDDVLDLGKTPEAMREYLISLGARSVELAVLVQKDIARRASGIHANYVGFHTSAQWLAGMGMKDNSDAPEAYRWRQEILELKPLNGDPQPALIS
jgi:hypoxanthine phosphoribosyltransferase